MASGVLSARQFGMNSRRLPPTLTQICKIRYSVEKDIGLFSHVYGRHSLNWRHYVVSNPFSPHLQVTLRRLLENSALSPTDVWHLHCLHRFIPVLTAADLMDYPLFFIETVYESGFLGIITLNLIYVLVLRISLAKIVVYAIHTRTHALAAPVTDAEHAGHIQSMNQTSASADPQYHRVVAHDISNAFSSRA